MMTVAVSGLSLDGDDFTVTFTSDWPEGITPDDIVGEDYFFQPVNLNVQVVEEDQIDTLNLFNKNSVRNDVGVMTDTMITGLGMSEIALNEDTPAGYPLREFREHQYRAWSRQ